MKTPQEKQRLLNELEFKIRDFIVVLDDKETLYQEDIDEMSEHLTRFVQQAVLKFIRGQQEHGGKIWERNLLAEQNQEQIDLFWYSRPWKALQEE